MAARAARLDLEWSVIGTLVWYGYRGRPLTVDELQRLLLKRTATRQELFRFLDKNVSIVKKHGYYSLAEFDVRYPDERSLRWYRYKWWRLGVAVGLLRHIPYVRMVGALQTVADKSATKRSDIDVFIVIKQGRLYLTRTLITGVLQLAGIRRHGNKITDRICLSWFISTDALDLRPITFEPWDPLLAWLFSEMVPVLDTERTYEQFVARNAWISDVIPAYAAKRLRAPEPSRFASIMERALDGRVGSFVERRLMKWQRKRIASRPPSSHPDVEIIATESMLKFHEKERRRLDRERWETKMKELGYDPSLVLTGTK